jgi:hypothetical protein
MSALHWLDITEELESSNMENGYGLRKRYVMCITARRSMKMQKAEQFPVQNWMNGIENMERGYAGRPAKGWD